MRKHKDNKAETQKNPKELKRRLSAALMMLLVASLLLTSTGYAWLVLSIRPEVTGISTNIGANGSLEIALLNTETYTNMSKIRTGAVGESLQTNSASANYTWGNLIDLSDSGFGLNAITLMPARIDAVAKEDGSGYVVNSGMLAIPTYGYDGRVIDVDEDAISAVYANKEFSLTVGTQDYGVRAIGTSDSLTVQGSALALAKSNVSTYTNSASNAAAGSLSENGDALFEDILVAHMLNASATYDDSDLAILKAMNADLQSALDYIDLTLRQGLVAYAASTIADEDIFVAARDKIVNTENKLPDLLTDMTKAGVQVPATFTTWVAKLDEAQNDLNSSVNACAALTSGTYSWAEISGAMSNLMNLDKVYINDTLYPNFDKSQAGEMMGGDVRVTLAPGSGVFASVADFTDDFSTMVSSMGTSVEITTQTTEDPVYLAALAAGISTLKEASGGDSSSVFTLNATYGYALDLAFRCNAAEADLLLQTSGEQRVYTDSTSNATQGGGSFMEFYTDNAGVSLSQTIQLMDAVRVGFMDDQGNLLGVAKLNVSNRETTDGVVKAPLYLYNYSISQEDGMVMGERQKKSTTLTTLQQNIAKAVTVVVWLDGDVVDNSMVSAQDTTLSGVLNLQFATSADLTPAASNQYMTLSVDKNELNTMLSTTYKATYTAGQGTYTSVSWNAFTVAYKRAEAVAADDNALASQVKSAAVRLTQAYKALEEVSDIALGDKIDEVRALVGSTEDVVSIVVEENGTYSELTSFTQKQYDESVAVINRVDYSENLRDEGNGIQTRIYTDESWSALARALYDAERICADENSTEEQIDAALTALDVSYDALEFGAYFLPYEYEGDIYYFAISKETDTYGKWYNSDFTRIVADKTILDLDAGAERVEIAEIVTGDYYAWNADTMSVDIDILDEYYPELKDEEIIGAKWTERDVDFFFDLMTDGQIAELNYLINENTTGNLGINTTAAQELLERETAVSVSEAQAAIDDLTAKVNAAKPSTDDSGNSVAELMDSDQRILLTTAVNNAKGISGYEGDDSSLSEEAKAKMTALRNAVANAEAILSAVEPTKEAADTALVELNTQLTANGEEEVTAYNTLVYSVPTGADTYEIVYATEYPTLTLGLVGKTGSATLGVTAVTRNGVVINVTKDVTIYTKAEGISINDYQPAEEIELAGYETIPLNVDLIYNVTDKEIELGNATDADNIVVPEHVKKVTWATSNKDCVTVDSEGVLRTWEEGWGNITVSVETVEGNVYTNSLFVWVRPDPNATEPEATEEPTT